MYYLGSRYYNPQWRRFISPSTSAINSSVVNGLNGYAYANNNPTTVTYGGSSVDRNTVLSKTSSISPSHLNLNFQYHNTNLKSANILGALGALSNAFAFFDQWFGYISGGIDGGLGFWGLNGLGFENPGKYSDVLGSFGKVMAVAGAVLSWSSSVYNNFTNSNYSIGEAIGASIMDAGYYGITGVLKYKLGLVVGSEAIKAGMALGTSAVGLAGSVGLGFAGSLVVGLSVGTIVAIGIGVAGAYAIYYVGGLIDDVWERVKKQIFE
jgi:hypothetical protein